MFFVLSAAIQFYFMDITKCSFVRRGWTSETGRWKHVHVEVHLLCFHLRDTDCICRQAHALTSIHRTFRPLHPNQFPSIGSTNCIDCVYVGTHQEWHLRREGSSMPSVAWSNSYSQPWHGKDSWWVVDWLAARSQSTLESIGWTKRKLSCLRWNIMEIPLSTVAQGFFEVTQQQAELQPCPRPLVRDGFKKHHR